LFPYGAATGLVCAVAPVLSAPTRTDAAKAVIVSLDRFRLFDFISSIPPPLADSHLPGWTLATRPSFTDTLSGVAKSALFILILIVPPARKRISSYLRRMARAEYYRSRHG
jgi:hypothetical protein